MKIGEEIDFPPRRGHCMIHDCNFLGLLCPHCAEEMKPRAKPCPVCGSLESWCEDKLTAERLACANRVTKRLSDLQQTHEGILPDIAADAAKAAKRVEQWEKERGQVLGGTPDDAERAALCQTNPPLDPAETQPPPTEPYPGDTVFRPNHYARFKHEPMKVLVENYGPVILIGHIIPYLMRYDAKNGLEDVRKAERCTVMLRKFLEGDPKWSE